MKGIIWTIVIIAVIVGGFWLIGRDGSDDLVLDDANNQQQEQGENNDQSATSTDNGAATGETTTITYTNDGFSPESVTVSVGDTVVFENESDRAFWPASAIHPTHALYPVQTADDCLGSAFDACRAVPAGESYSFTFTEAGEWNFHDHIKANERGTVVVEATDTDATAE